MAVPLPVNALAAFPTFTAEMPKPHLEDLMENVEDAFDTMGVATRDVWFSRWSYVITWMLHLAGKDWSRPSLTMATWRREKHFPDELREIIIGYLLPANGYVLPVAWINFRNTSIGDTVRDVLFDLEGTLFVRYGELVEHPVLGIKYESIRLFVHTHSASEECDDLGYYFGNNIETLCGVLNYNKKITYVNTTGKKRKWSRSWYIARILKLGPAINCTKLNRKLKVCPSTTYKYDSTIFGETNILNGAFITS